MDKPNKFSYLPGAIQLIVIPIILSVAGVRNYYIFNSFRIFDNFDPYTIVKVLKMTPKVVRSENCLNLGIKEIHAFESIQKTLNLKSSFPVAITIPKQNDLDILTPCYDLNVFLTKVNKYEFYSQEKIISERLIWTTNQKK